MNGFLYGVALQWKLDIRSKIFVGNLLYRSVYFLSAYGWYFYFCYA